MSAAPPSAPPSAQASSALADEGQPLFATTFVVLDLETTGASPAADRITEIGAVKVRGGTVLGEFATLVDPGVSVPGDVVGLTGLTDALLGSAPPLGAVLPSLLDFVAGTVVVAHNAPFDIGFLHAACAATDRTWPAGVVVDTVRLARAVLDRDEVPDCRLGTLAAFFRSTVTPDHRALSDARATVQVLHALLERLGSVGVRTLGDLRAHSGRETSAQLGRRHLADPLPHGPGVFTFRDEDGAALLTGRAEDLRRGVRRYFTADETRVRVLEAVALTATVDAVPCRTDLESRLRELRQVAAERPRLAAPAARPRWWVTAAAAGTSAPPSPGTAAAAPPPVVAPTPRPGRESVGPFASRSAARAAADAVVTSGGALTDAAAVRASGASGVEAYLEARRGADRTRSVLDAPLLVIAAPTGDGGWDVDGLSRGTLVAAERVPPGERPGAAAARVRDATFARGPAAGGPADVTSAAGAGEPADAAPDHDELDAVVEWLGRPGVRLAALDGTWACPLAFRPAVPAGARTADPPAVSGWSRPPIG